MFLAALGYGSQVIADSKAPDWVLEFPENWACEFPVSIGSWNGKAGVRETKDKNGFVRVIFEGEGGGCYFLKI